MPPSTPDPTAPIADADAADWRAVREIGHDLSNQIGVIDGYAEMLLEDAAPRSGLAADLERIRQATASVTQILERLRDLCRRHDPGQRRSPDA